MHADTWSLSRMCMPVGPCLYTWWILPNGMSHTDAILRMSSAAVSSSKYRAWYTNGTQNSDGVKRLVQTRFSTPLVSRNLLFTM